MKETGKRSLFFKWHLYEKLNKDHLDNAAFDTCKKKPMLT